MSPDHGNLLGVPCTWMRGGTSKGAFFLKKDLPATTEDSTEERDSLLLAVMGSPDPRQIDGIGGADPLTSKVAIVNPSNRADADVDYLFLQVFVDQAIVTDAQNCGNILAAVVQFSIERGLVEPASGKTTARVYMVNSDQVAIVTVASTEQGAVYGGDAAIDGVPGTGSAVLQNFPDAAGSSCGSLLPSGNVRDSFDGIDVTLIDNGMPVVVLRAGDLGIEGYESREQLDANDGLKSRLESIRLQAGHAMNLGDVSQSSVPKMTLVAAPRNGGAICSRTFIPHRCHASIGVLGAVSVATACVLENSVCSGLAQFEEDATGAIPLSVEHPIGETTVVMEIDQRDGKFDILQAAILRTARKLFDGTVYAPPNR